MSNPVSPQSTARRPVSAEPDSAARMRPYVRSIFGEMSRLATDLGAINLGQGFPDTDGPGEISDAAIAAITRGEGNQYPPVHGLPELRQAISTHQQRHYQLTVDWQREVVVGTGAAEIIAAAILALVSPGDEVLMLDPYFDQYPAVVALAGGTRVAVPLSTSKRRPDLDAIRDAITPRTRVLLLNSPHNPTGLVLTREELTQLAALAVENDLLVVSDEAYEHLWYDGHQHIPIASLPGMWERTITIGSAGKSFSFTGWKVGWGTGPADLIAAVRTVRQHLSYVSSGPFQWAIAEALAATNADPENEYFNQFRAQLTSRRDLLSDGLGDLGFSVLPPQGTYFVTTDVRPVGFTSGTDFCDLIPTRAGVVAIPEAALSDHPDISSPYVRWAFCKQPTVLRTALTRLAAMVD